MFLPVFSFFGLAFKVKGGFEDDSLHLFYLFIRGVCSASWKFCVSLRCYIFDLTKGIVAVMASIIPFKM